MKLSRTDCRTTVIHSSLQDELERVLEWCEKHKDDAPMVEVPDDGKEKITSDIPEWDKNFLEVR